MLWSAAGVLPRGVEVLPESDELFAFGGDLRIAGLVHRDLYAQRYGQLLAVDGDEPECRPVDSGVLCAAVLQYCWLLGFL